MFRKYVEITSVKLPEGIYDLIRAAGSNCGVRSIGYEMMITKHIP
jgi:hypothetical protein